MDFNRNYVVPMMDRFELYARAFDIKFTDVDRAYVSNVIYKDKCYNLILFAFEGERYSRGWSKLERAHARINVIVFLEKFYNDIFCPYGVRLVLFAILGQYRGDLQEEFPNLLDYRYRYVKRWFETIT